MFLQENEINVFEKVVKPTHNMSRAKNNNILEILEDGARGSCIGHEDAGLRGHLSRYARNRRALFKGF